MGTLVINGFLKMRLIIYGEEADQFIWAFLSQLGVSVYPDRGPIERSYNNNFASLERINIRDIWVKFQSSLKQSRISRLLI